CPSWLLLLSCAWRLTRRVSTMDTSGDVKLLLPPRQSRGNSLKGLAKSKHRPYPLIINLAVVPRIDRQRLARPHDLVDLDPRFRQARGDIPFQIVPRVRLHDQHGPIVRSDSGDPADAVVVSPRGLLGELGMNEAAATVDGGVDAAGDPEAAFRIEG